MFKPIGDSAKRECLSLAPPQDTPPSDQPPDDPGNPTVNFRGEKRSNVKHQSTTDPGARLSKKGRGFESRLAYVGHALMDNRHGLLVDFQLTQASGTAERDIVPQLLYDAKLRGVHPRTLGADKAYDARVCGDHPRTASHSAGGAKHEQAAQRHQSTHDAAAWLRHQPALRKAG